MKSRIYRLIGMTSFGSFHRNQVEQAPACTLVIGPEIPSDCAFLTDMVSYNPRTLPIPRR